MIAKKAFTLLELLVAMAIIAILIALAIFGVLQVQKNSRDTQRRKAMEDVNIGIQAFYSKYGQYPDSITFVDNTATLSGGGNSSEVELNNSAKAAASGANTNTNVTKYGYVNDSAGYKLGFCDEDGDVYNAGIHVDGYADCNF